MTQFQGCRYTEWIEGSHVEFTQFPWRVPSKNRGQGLKGHPVKEVGKGGSLNMHGRNGRGAEGAVGWQEDDYWVYLRRLRHPVLHGWYLEQLAAWRKSQVRLCAEQNCTLVDTVGLFILGEIAHVSTSASTTEKAESAYRAIKLCDLSSVRIYRYSTGYLPQ
jgi:hypothetical protein